MACTSINLCVCGDCAAYICSVYMEGGNVMAYLIKVFKNKNCKICGKEFVPVTTNQTYCCAECRMESKRIIAREKSKMINEERKIEVKKRNEENERKRIRSKKPRLSIGEISVLARKAGMTYGQYVAQMYRRGE